MLKKQIAGFILSSLTVLLFSTACAQEDNRSFSLRELFGISKKSKEVLVTADIHPDSLTDFSEEISTFYKNRNFRPAWFNGRSLNSLGDELIQLLKHSTQQGLPDPTAELSRVDHALLRLNDNTVRKKSHAEIISDADVHLTLAWFNYASGLSSGIIHPDELNIIWEVLPEQPDLVSYLEKAITRRNIHNSFDDLKPDHDQYDLLLEAYNSLTELRDRGGWPLPGIFDTLKEGDTDTNVVNIKKYLLATGDLNISDDEYVTSPAYDAELVKAVKRFQYRHGLQADGIAGEGTLQQMNVPLDYRINQVRMNIDRIRWLPDDFGRHHIRINIPDFSLLHNHNGEIIQEMKVVVGKNENYTPVLEDTLHSVIFNPTWNIPNSIATTEVLPGLLEDSTYMERNNYSVLRDSYTSTDTIDYKSHDWSEVSRDSFPYFVVQHPGPANSLGKVQFMLQNQYSIFLHDTPADNLFNIEQRDFSHGCIRLERPAELAVMLLKNQMPADTILKYVSENEKKVVRLEEKIPVHILYITAWIDEEEFLHFRDDIYDFDKQAMAVLESRLTEKH